jgi:hypothetical protein
MCAIEVEEDEDKRSRPSFVFVSPNNYYTALTLTKVPIHTCASIYVNFIQPDLFKRSYWRATCFEPLDSRPVIVDWARTDIDLVILRHAILACVLTFNSMNGETEHEAEDYEEFMNMSPCPYDKDL